MGRLVLMRHAKSDYPVGVPDHDRPLAPRGRRQAPLMAPLLSEIIDGHPWVLSLVSTAVRAQQTWELVAAGLSCPVRVRTHPRLYESDPSMIAECVREAGDADLVIVVAHNPGLEDAVHRWAGECPDRFPTSAFAVLDCEQPWERFDAVPPRLRSFHVAR